MGDWHGIVFLLSSGVAWSFFSCSRMRDDNVDTDVSLTHKFVGTEVADGLVAYWGVGI
jgi:hypothetical protein